MSMCAIHYDALNERVFVGGGCRTPRAVSYFDIGQQKWVSLPDTNHDHGGRCVIWSNASSANNIVYIGGNNQKDLGVVECIDIKERKWEDAPPEMQLRHDPLIDEDDETKWHCIG